MDRRLFLVEDDPRLCRALTDLFLKLGYAVEVAGDGCAALNTAKTRPFDLIILDVMLPSISGFDVCSALRRSGVDTPVLMLTARDHVTDKISGFKSGADDYLTKPFDTDELRLRVEALLRRSSRKRLPAPVEIKLGNARINFTELSVVRPEGTLWLTEREGRLLRYLFDNCGQVVSRDTLLIQVWGYSTAPYTRTVDVHILRLRQKIEDDPKNPRFILTAPGLGYRFNP